jgi:hypothetical protein
MTSSKSSNRGQTRNLRKREARVVYIVLDPGSEGPEAQAPQAHYVGAEQAAKRLAAEIHLRRGVPIRVHKAKVPKLTPRQSLLWALNFADHGGMNNLGFGTKATCESSRLARRSSSSL